MFSYEKWGVSTKQLVTLPNRGFKKGRFPRRTVLGGCGSSTQVFPHFWAHGDALWKDGRIAWVIHCEVLTMFQPFTFPRKHSSPTELPWREVSEQHNHRAWWQISPASQMLVRNRVFSAWLQDSEKHEGFLSTDSAIVISVNSSPWCHKLLTHCLHCLLHTHASQTHPHGPPSSVSFCQEYLAGQTRTPAQLWGHLPWEAYVLVFLYWSWSLLLGFPCPFCF